MVKVKGILADAIEEMGLPEQNTFAWLLAGVILLIDISCWTNSLTIGLGNIWHCQINTFYIVDFCQTTFDLFS